MRFAQFSSGFALVAGLLLLGGCSQTTEFVAVSSPDNQPLGARLSRAAVIRVAGHAAEKAGYRLIDFKDAQAHYQYTDKDRTWTVFFYGLGAMEGRHFLVFVDDRTGEPLVMPEK